MKLATKYFSTNFRDSVEILEYFFLIWKLLKVIFNPFFTVNDIQKYFDPKNMEYVYVPEMAQIPFAFECNQPNYFQSILEEDNHSQFPNVPPSYYH